MSLMDRFLTRSRVKSARQRLAEEPTVSNYVALAGEHARTGEMDAALRVCEEGLALYPSSVELSRLATRAHQLGVEDRVKELSRELRDAPRPAVFRELCELLLSADRAERAEEYAIEWHSRTGEAEAVLMQAMARAERFFADRSREDGRLAWELLDRCEPALDGDERPITLRLRLAACVGAWEDALRCVSRLLELYPGDPELEARYRALQSRAEESRAFEPALREVEKTGLFADEVADPVAGGRTPSSSSIRSLLKRIANDSGVQAALFTRGSTALVQGPRGATAERTARAVREVVQQSRNTARRLGLGQAHEIRLDGSFGSLLVVPGDQGSGAVWRRGPVAPVHVQELQSLVGSTATVPGRTGA